MKPNTEEQEEVSNVFEMMLRSHRRGLIANEVSRKFQEALQASRETGAKASLTLSVIIKPSNDDQVLIDVQVDTKMPKEKLPPSTFWIGDKNTLHTSDPRQPELPLRAVREPSELRDVSNG
jgi:hypothetical protein